MAWLKVCDRFARGPKVKRAAMLLGGTHARRRILACWFDGMSYCNQHMTDGFVPDYEIADFDDEDTNAVFVAMSKGDSGLGAIVERDKTRAGWVFRNYLEYQPSRESIEEKLKNERARKQAWRDSVKRPGGVRDSSAGRFPESNVPDPIRSDPTRSDPFPCNTAIARPAGRPRGQGDYDPDFLTAWAAYPNRTGKGAAGAAWRKVRPVLADVLSALAWQKNQPKWVEEGGRFIPHFATWLNQRRWEDEPFHAPVSTAPARGDGHGTRLAKAGVEYLRRVGALQPHDMRETVQIGSGEVINGDE